MKSILPLFVLWSGTVQAGEAYLALGKGLNEALIQSGSIASSEALELGYSLASPHVWSLSRTADLNLRLEIAAARLQGRHRGREDRLDIQTLRPVLRWQADADWYAEFGLGYARLSSDEYEEIRMAKEDNFSLIAGVGLALDAARDWRLTLRYNHYSNGYTASPNPGLDYATLNLSRSL
ncbi:MAG: acyloxyacyl hydrolase [Gammaproteobacteria bacterium]|nr:acyloxyacyl hydrolase [Gammaproteobacteria bacterium]